MDFKEVLLDLLLEKNEGSQTNLARQTGIPIPTINGWFTKDKLPRVEQLIALSNYYSVSVDYLLGREEDVRERAEYAAKRDPSINKKTEERARIIKNLSKMSLSQLKVVSSLITLLEEKAEINPLEEK